MKELTVKETITEAFMRKAIIDSANRRLRANDSDDLTTEEEDDLVDSVADTFCDCEPLCHFDTCKLIDLGEHIDCWCEDLIKNRRDRIYLVSVSVEIDVKVPVRAKNASDAEDCATDLDLERLYDYATELPYGPSVTVNSITEDDVDNYPTGTYEDARNW